MSGHCLSCNAPIKWARTAFNGTPLPVDVEPTYNGNVLLELKDGLWIAHVLPPGDDRIANETTHTSHFATCPDAEKWRKRHHA